VKVLNSVRVNLAVIRFAVHGDHLKLILSTADPQKG